MDKRKGFTLVELLAVIVILAIILIIAVPGVLSIINKTKSSSYESQLKMIKEATRTYITTQDQIQWKDNQTVVNLSDLQGVGLLDNKLIDPRDKAEIRGLSVVVEKKGTKISYEIVYTDKSNANYPTYNHAMIPIVYDGSKWVKADPTNENNTWFDYTNQQWANVATVTEDVRQTLVDVPVGTEIPMDKINAMFVWIPRYKYKLWNVDGKVGPIGNANMVGDYEIDIRFEGKETPKSKGSQNGEWLTHPAFTFGDQEVSGLWIAKFETGYKDATTTQEAQQSIVDPSKVIIKPNVYSWTRLTMKKMYDICMGMKENNNVFGFTTSEDPHLMKNSEWGAMVYLTYSSYGKASNDNYIGAEKEVRLNNSQNLITGCGADSQNAPAAATCNTYNTTQGKAASTTGNITGIYDTSGGVWEYMASDLIDETGQFVKNEWDGFEIAELNQLGHDRKYLEGIPVGESSEDDSKDTLGSARKEMGPNADGISSWYEDYAIMPNIQNPWISRGGSYDRLQASGITAFHLSGGGARTIDGFRIVGI